VRVRGPIRRNSGYRLKRAFDVVGSSLLLLVFAPVLAVLGVLIRRTSPGPVFFKQTRLGRSATPFEFVKLRSMVLNTDVSIHSEYVLAFMRGDADAVECADGGEAVYKRIDDPRITSVGKVIRKYSLDELPQLFNVLRGDMSLVGPRPPLPYEASAYDQWCALRLAVPSGVTGLWQVAGRSRVSFDEMILQDLMYAQNMRLLLDVKLCLGTIPAMLLGYGGG
jgi:lipopolysaccharide/colanic/teichoic acid biosynthesis glycosyltransferase